MEKRKQENTEETKMKTKKQIGVNDLTFADIEDIAKISGVGFNDTFEVIKAVVMVIRDKGVE